MKGFLKKMCVFITLVAVLSSGSGWQVLNIKAATESTLKLNKTSMVVGIGKYKTKKLIATVTGPNKIVNFKTSNSKVATVSSFGYVTGVSEGKAKIICTIKGTDKKAVCEVTVRRLVESIKMQDDPYINFSKAGETYKIKLTVLPDDATMKSVEYTASNKSVATVNSKGVITAVAPGTATIVVKAKDGSDKTMNINVKVLNGEYDMPVGVTKQKNIPHGILQEITYYSSFTGNDRKALIYTPPGYTTDKKYNVLYLGHGMGCNHWQWQWVGTQNIMDTLYDESKAEDMIIVMPNCYARANDEDTGMDGKDYNEFIKAWDDLEFELEQSLMPYIEDKYSVYTGPEHTAIAGLSMGAREACNIGLKRTDMFSYIGMFSPAPTSDAVKNFASLIKDEKHTQYPPKAIWLSVGSNDSISNAPAASIKKVMEQDDVQAYLKDNNVKYVYYNMKGEGHSDPVWQHGLYYFAQMIFK